MMKIVFDTNVIFKDWFFKTPNMELLKKYLDSSDSKLVIPKIVLAEVLNKYKESVYEKLNLAKKLNGLLLESQKIELPDIENISNNYRTYLEKVIKEFKVEQPDHSEIPHNDIIQRDLSRRRPFQVSGKGYRDTLLWEVIVREIASAETKTYFISDNWNDFGNKDKNKLHEHLQEDLKNNGLSIDSVILLYNLSDFIEKFVKPSMKAITDLTKGHYKSFDFYNWFKDNREKIGIEIDKYLESIFPDLEGPSVAYVEDPKEIEIFNIYILDENRVLIESNVNVDVNLDVFVFKNDYVWLSDKYDFSIWDNDWNKHYMWTQLFVNLPISVNLIFNINNQKVENFEVAVQEIYGFCPHCSAPILSDAAEACSKCGKPFF